MNKKIGLLLRSYAKNPEDVAGVVARARKSIAHANSLHYPDGEAIFQAIVVLVPQDYDCGGTSRALLKEINFFEDCDVCPLVQEASGYHSCGALNVGITILDLSSFDYAVIISNKAIQSLTTETMEAMLEAFDRGAKVVGVAVDELQDVVLEGRIQNTFSGWDVQALVGVGGFDSEKDVEEVSPTVRLIFEHGPCIAVLDPTDKTALDIRKSADGKDRHKEVMTTKLARQLEEADRMGVGFNFIKGGIMSSYPRTI